MRIIIKDKEMGTDNYDCNIYIDGYKKVLQQNRKEDMVVECPNECSIVVEYKNIALEGKYIEWFGLFYWILVLITGTNEPHPFGLPFDAILKLHCKGQDNIIIKMNKISNKTAFSVLGDCEIVTNHFITREGYKRKWFLLEAIPLAIMIFLLFMIFFIFVCDALPKMFVIKYLLIAGLVLAELFWGMYVIKVLKR